MRSWFQIWPKQEGIYASIQLYSAQRSCSCPSDGSLASIRACAKPALQRGIGLRIDIEYPESSHTSYNSPGWDAYCTELDRRREALKNAMKAAAVAFFQELPRGRIGRVSRISGYLYLVSGAGTADEIKRAQDARAVAVEFLRKEGIGVLLINDDGGKESLAAFKSTRKARARR